MAKRGIKIKALAQELGVTSRQLIDRCRAEGMEVQSSITRLDPRSVERIRSWFTTASARREPTRSKDAPGGV